MSFTIANTNYPELIDRLNCVSRDSAVYPTKDSIIHFPTATSTLYVKMDIRILSSSEENKSKTILSNSNGALLKSDYFNPNKLFIENKSAFEAIPLDTREWHSYFLVFNNGKLKITIDGIYKGECTLYSNSPIGSIILHASIWYKNIIISDQSFNAGATPIEVPITSVSGWDSCGENSYVADNIGQTCTISLDKQKMNDIEKSYDISRLVCTGIIDRQGDNFNSLGVVYGNEKKNLSIDVGEHTFSADNTYGDSNTVQLIAKKV